MRIAGIDLPKEERIEIGLTRIFGVGRTISRKVLKDASVDPHKRVKNLSDEEGVKIRNIIDRDCKVEGELKRAISMDIKRLIDIGSYRGTRHRLGLPLRGQRTKTNARTRKGPRKAIALKKKATL
ncbi:MAG: 30S ribosomal protein S13 [Thermodesulfovibrionia bacterium]|nr:30S ribosomal protein S13 [Thermodesulfovibrionia bacterium]MCK5286875.1 30S ribosomal protein S13 [Thermodesulfovibrionia bacterium]